MERSERSGALLGTCITYLDSAPLAGVALTFLHESEVVAVAYSDEGGSFEIELPGGGFDEVRVRAPAGWWCAEHGLRDDVYRVLLAPGDVGPLRATLVDRNTGERVPHYLLRLRDAEGWSETVKSDAQGRLQSEVYFTRGPIAVEVLPEEIGGQRSGYLAAYIEHVPGGNAPAWKSIALTVGATYRLDLDNPGLVPIKRLRAYLTTLRWVDLMVESPTAAASVREGELPWTRFSGPAAWVDDLYLVVTDSGGQWQGSALVHSKLGVQPEPVAIRLGRMLRVRGRVFDLRGEPVARADVTLTPMGGDAAGRERESSTNGTGLFLLEGVRPGAYELFVRHTRAGMATERIELTTESEDIKLTLEPYNVAGDVAGVVRSLSGGFRGDLTLSLRPAEGESGDLPARMIRVAWQEVGAGFEAPFRFEGVPTGRYHLETFLRQEDFDVSPSQQVVIPPDETLDILVRDDKPRFRMDFLVLDALTDEWLDESQVRILDSSGELAYEGPAMGWKAARLFAEGETMQWKVHHPGYHSKFGGRAEFDALTEDGDHTAVLKLEKD